MTTPDQKLLDDLAAFARVEVEACDIEPWAATLDVTRMWLGYEDTAWLVKLYNATDNLATAVGMANRWATPYQWAHDYAGRDCLADAVIGRERRNLRATPGGLAKHLDSYVDALNGKDQFTWLRDPIPPGAYRDEAFDALVRYLRLSCWGTGRLAGFEWAEFAGKVLRVPVKAGHGCLWESSGPRQALEWIYNGGKRADSDDQLRNWATECHSYLAWHGAELDWWDFETVICDFNVMRKGRYYPGQHIAMLREEIQSMHPAWSQQFAVDMSVVIPYPWHNTPPGVNKKLAANYADTGKIRTPTGRIIKT